MVQAGSDKRLWWEEIKAWHGHFEEPHLNSDKLNSYATGDGLSFYCTYQIQKSTEILAPSENVRGDLSARVHTPLLSTGDPACRVY